MSQRSATAFKALLALGACPGDLTEAALRKACGSRTTKRELARLLEDLGGEGLVTSETRRGRLRVRLAAAGRQALASSRVPVRSRFSGKHLNALLEVLSALSPPADAAGGPEPLPAPSRQDVEERLLAAHRRHARGPTATATLPELRAALSGVDPASVDEALRNLERQGVLFLGRAVDLGALGPNERAAGLEDPVRGLLLYASAGQGSRT